MTGETSGQHVEKVPTGIAGFDVITEGGLPKNRTTLISGSAGSAKTVAAVQFLIESINRHAQSGVFVAFEESPGDIRRNMYGFGWDLAALEEQGKLMFVDASPQVGGETIIAGDFDLGALLARIEHAVNAVGATRISVDSIDAVLNRFGDVATVRHELFRLASALRRMGLTAVLTSERTTEYGAIARYGVEEFVADNVIILRNVLEDEKRRRTIEVLKFRGCGHQKGEYPFTLVPKQGLVVIPLSAM